MNYRLILMVLLAITFGCKDEHTNTKDHDIHLEDADRDHDHHQNVEKEKRSVAQQKKELLEKGYQIFDYIDPDTGDTVIMQQYFIAFLKRGTNRDQDSTTAASLQRAHLEHLGRMYYEGYADISGPMGDDGDLRGITIYNVPTLQMADSLANMDPMVKAGRLEIEVKPWWAAKGFLLR